jgi:hypothetical protein
MSQVEPGQRHPKSPFASLLPRACRSLGEEKPVLEWEANGKCRDRDGTSPSRHVKLGTTPYCSPW